jgi:Domain of unknown function (DUF5753)
VATPAADVKHPVSGRDGRGAKQVRGEVLVLAEMPLAVLDPVVTAGPVPALHLRRISRRTYLAHRGLPPLHRAVGGRAVMQAQLERLLELAELPNVTLRVIPYEAGALPAGNNKFIILRFASPELKDTVFIEGLTGDLYLDEPGEVEVYNTTFRTLIQLARSPDQTRELIAGMIPGYCGQPG